ncbi:Cys-rich peptide radical SAM maturase CcpM [Anaerosacchariphilus polymeriproducens]|nr:Cys-rich peptide radical SAM maturase CcpM [Anaerosacchariphilus polymeriproducens]
MTEYIFKCFRTKRNGYFYDRHRNEIVKVTDEEYEELCFVNQGRINPEKSSVFQKYQQQGLFQENIVKKIQHPETDYLEHHMNNRLGQLILQVTQQCNLRCSYCAYSGKYKNNRTHSNKRMTWDIAKKAIDFYVARIIEKEEAIISFYGGEPLLEFELIKQCVAYAKDKIQGKPLRFAMTTNGTLLTDEVVDFLQKEKFETLISLDGAEKEHDCNRKYASGKGSFQDIMKNVKRIKERYPEYGTTLMFNTVVNPQADVRNVQKYFDNDKLLEENHISFNLLRPKDLDEVIPYSKEALCIRKFEYLKVLLALTYKVKLSSVSKIVREGIGVPLKFYKEMSKKTRLTEECHHNGPCLPGIQRLFITVEGKFFPCEKVDEMVDAHCIGDIQNGFRLNKLKELLNIGKITEEECKQCWNLQNCSMCIDNIECVGEEKQCKRNKLKVCQEKKEEVLQNLYELCVLKELGCDFEGAFNREEYDDISIS